MPRSIVGLQGQVTGTIRPGKVGEVTLPFGGGTNAYHALPADNETTYPTGHLVEVTAFSPPQTVYVKSAS